MSTKHLIIAGIILVVGTAIATAVGLLPFWLVAVVTTIMWLRHGYKRAKTVIMPLEDNGVPATATVTRKGYDSNPRSIVYISYSFETEQGRFDAKTEGFIRQLDHLEVGDSIDILYLPEQPKINAPKWVVDEMRQARKDIAAKAARQSAEDRV